MALHTTPLHPKFGVEVFDVDLRDVTAGHLYPEIRALFEHHSALLFRGQDLSEAAHTRLSELFGPLENRDALAGLDAAFTVPMVSNETEDGVIDPDSLGLLDLKANMLWHTDSTFLPIPALTNIITAKVVPSSGGQTQLASTRAGWAEMPDDLRAIFRDAIIWHNLTHSRAQVDDRLLGMTKINRWPDRPWRAIWPNPVTGAESLYIASHAFAIEGMEREAAQRAITAAIEFCTRDAAVYSHAWSVGDVLIWDERAVLHRGRPWPYAEPRTLQSICTSVTEADGLSSVRLV